MPIDVYFTESVRFHRCRDFLFRIVSRLHPFSLRSVDLLRHARGREIDCHDGMLRAHLLALAANAALLGVDVSEIVSKSDSAERTLLLTLAATDASHTAG